MVSNDLISIVIPVKNERDRIRTIIEGLYKQSHRPIEIIFVDGGSTEGTIDEVLDVIKAYSTINFKIRLLKESDFGGARSLPNARNIGALNAGGEYVAFFDADFDFREDPEAIGKVIKAFRDGADHVAVKYVPNAHTWIEKNLALDDVVHYFKGGKPIHLICAFKKELFKEVRFNPKLGFREDFEFLNRLGKRARLNTMVVDTSIRRCYPHTLRGLKRQQLWYGRTAIRYYKLAGVNLLATLVRSNAVLGLIALTTITAPMIGLPSLIFLLFALALICVRWLRRDAETLGLNRLILERLAWYLFRETAGRMFFDVGFVASVIRSADVGR
jgi:glycosyltransferase involved in cell wall biosynthesis